MRERSVSYRIRDWNRYFETSELREEKGTLTWIAVPVDRGQKQYQFRYQKFSRHPCRIPFAISPFLTAPKVLVAMVIEWLEIMPQANGAEETAGASADSSRLQQIAADRRPTGQDGTGPDKTGPDKTGPDKTGPDKTGYYPTKNTVSDTGTGTGVEGHAKKSRMGSRCLIPFPWRCWPIRSGFWPGTKRLGRIARVPLVSPVYRFGVGLTNRLRSITWSEQ